MSGQQRSKDGKYVAKTLEEDKTVQAAPEQRERTSFTQKERAHMELPPAVEETLVTLAAAPRCHAPLGQLGDLSQHIMTPIGASKSRFPIALVAAF